MSSMTSGWNIGERKGKMLGMPIPGHHCIEHFRNSSSHETKPQSDGGSFLSKTFRYGQIGACKTFGELVKGAKQENDSRMI